MYIEAIQTQRKRIFLLQLVQWKGNRGGFFLQGRRKQKAWIIVGPNANRVLTQKSSTLKALNTKAWTPLGLKLWPEALLLLLSSLCLLSLFWVLPQEEKSFANHARRDHPGIPRQNYNPRHSLPILPDTIVCQRALFSWSNGLHWEEKWRARMLPEVLTGKVFRVSVHCPLVISVER